MQKNQVLMLLFLKSIQFLEVFQQVGQERAIFLRGMHWLTGSSEKLALNKVWREVGALKDNNPIYYRDPFYTLLNENGGTLRLFRDIDKTCDEFMKYAPEDKKAIKKLKRDVKAFVNVHLVINDIARLKATSPKRPKSLELLKMLPLCAKIYSIKKSVLY